MSSYVGSLSVCLESERLREGVKKKKRRKKDEDVQLIMLDKTITTELAAEEQVIFTDD